MSALLSTAGALSWLLGCAMKAALLFAASALGATLLRRSSAAARHQIWTLGVLGSLLLPLLCWAMPSLALPPALARLARTASFDAPAIAVTAGSSSNAGSSWPWPELLAIAWAAGALIVGLRLMRGHLAARRLLRTAEPTVAVSWSMALREAAAALELERPIPLLRSEAIGSPMTICVGRPRVLLPASADGWDPDRLRAVLVHELGHVRRHDTAIQLAAQLACVLYWWNPLAWLAAARLRVEREHACDDLVLGAGTLPSSYAADLLEVARAMASRGPARNHPPAQESVTCMVDQSWTETRLRRILDATAPRRPLPPRVRVAMRGLALACAVTLACTSSPRQERSSPQAAPSPQAVPTGTLTVGEPFARQPGRLRSPGFLQPPSLQEELDLTLVTAEVKRRLGPLRECYQRRLADTSSASASASASLAGTVVIHWTIAENGEVPESCITSDTVGDPELADCVSALVHGGRFPAPRGGAVPVSFPFVFADRTKVAQAR